MAFSLSRNAKLFVSTANITEPSPAETLTEQNTWEINVLDGFSFSAAVDTQEIEINEAGATPARGQQVFTTAIQPAEWSLQAYIRPRYTGVTDDKVDAVERVLWEGLAAQDPSNLLDTDSSGQATTIQANSAGGMTVDFTNSNTNELKILHFYWNLGTTASPVWYKMTGSVVNQAEIDFAIDAIASITWSGFADSIAEVTDTSELANLNAMLAAPATYSDLPFTATAGHLAAPTGQQACIRNKLTQVSLVADAGQDGIGGNTYTLALTGGTLTINNNITFLTPEALGVVNQPCGHFTGQLQVTGNMTAYLKTGSLETGDLLNDLLTYSTGANASASPNRFALDIYIGGAASDTTSPFENPIVHVNLPDAHLVIPTINIEDVVAVDIPFIGLPYETDGTTPDPSAGNEINLTYYAAE